MPQLELQIISRGLVLRDEQHIIPNPELQQSEFSFVVTSEMTPTFIVMASYISDNDEVVADYITMAAKLELKNKVSTMLLFYSSPSLINLLISVLILVSLFHFIFIFFKNESNLC